MKARPILLVEDSPDDELLTRRALAKHNFRNEIVVRRDGEEALRYLLGDGLAAPEGGEELPQVVLLDLKLPKVDGLEVLRRLRADERTRRLPVVILTSSDERSDIVAGYDRGANGYVRKPVEFTEFARAVGQLGLYWLLVNEPPPSGGAS